MNTVGAIIKLKLQPDAPVKMRRIVQQLTTRGAVVSPEVMRHVLVPVAMVLLSKIAQSFIQKSRGETGSDGIRWKPLSPRTIAGRRTTRAELKSLGITGRRERGFLTPAENRRWKGIFGTRLARFLVMGMDESSAKARAAQIAWATVKSEGAKTKLQVLGLRKVDIGRDTGALLRSLSPGVRRYPQQIRDCAGGQVMVGSNLPYAERFHKSRKLWPDVIPPAWMPELTAAFQRGIIRLLAGKA